MEKRLEVKTAIGERTFGAAQDSVNEEADKFESAETSLSRRNIWPEALELEAADRYYLQCRISSRKHRSETLSMRPSQILIVQLWRGRPLQQMGRSQGNANFNRFLLLILPSFLHRFVCKLWLSDKNYLEQYITIKYVQFIAPLEICWSDRIPNSTTMSMRRVAMSCSSSQWGFGTEANLPLFVSRKTIPSIEMTGTFALLSRPSAISISESSSPPKK